MGAQEVQYAITYVEPKLISVLHVRIPLAYTVYVLL
jgi:hypothetical protein